MYINTREISRLKLANIVRDVVWSKPDRKIEVIKDLRTMLGLSLVDAMRLVEAALGDPLLVEIEKIEKIEKIEAEARWGL
jgi:ribosomal protein L7/L12